MPATLYDPGYPDQHIDTLHLAAIRATAHVGAAMNQVAELLQCPLAEVDTLASGPDYSVFSVFNHGEDANLAGMELVADLAGIELDPNDEDELLRGPIVAVR